MYFVNKYNIIETLQLFFLTFQILSDCQNGRDSGSGLSRWSGRAYKLG